MVAAVTLCAALVVLAFVCYRIAFGGATVAAPQAAPAPAPRPSHGPSYDKAKWEAYWTAYREALAAHPAPEITHRLVRNKAGLWIAQAYGGGEDPMVAVLGADFGPPAEPPVIVDRWRCLGPSEGFLYRADAERFLAAYMAETQTLVPIPSTYPPAASQE